MSDPMEPILAIGDVHGDVDRLRALLQEFRRFEGKVVMVGDYINRGPQSLRVIETILEEKARRGDSLVLLCGNHERALLRFLQGGPLADFARHGGLATISSYVGRSLRRNAAAEFKEHFPRAHLVLIRHLSRYFQTPEVFISHGGFDTLNPFNLDTDCLIDGNPDIFTFTGDWPRPTVVVGHFLQTSRRPLITNNLVAIDTGCGTLDGAPLTAVRLPDRTVFQF